LHGGEHFSVFGRGNLTDQRRLVPLPFGNGHAIVMMGKGSLTPGVPCKS
jgi:hypothetical protein